MLDTIKTRSFNTSLTWLSNSREHGCSDSSQERGFRTLMSMCGVNRSNWLSPHIGRLNTKRGTSMRHKLLPVETKSTLSVWRRFARIEGYSLSTAVPMP